jgi:hypothetical protein
MKPRRYYLDTEFLEDGKTIELISIAIVSGDDRLYLCNADANMARVHADPWLEANVVPHLPDHSAFAWRSRAEIRDAVLAFVKPEPKPEFWAYYADYDWVALCQLFGRMIDLPEHFPKFCMDLKQLSRSLGSPEHPPQGAGEHDALADALWNRELHEFLLRHEIIRKGPGPR